MRTIVRKARQLNLADFRLRSAQESDVSEVLQESFKLIDPEDGETKAVYLAGGWTPEDDIILDEMFEALKRVKYDKTARTAGLVTTSKVFGWKPRQTIRSDFCTATSMATDQPAEHAIVVKAATLVGRMYREHEPALYRQHRELADERVRDEFLLEDEVFTSGIINENNPLHYHFDAGNFRGVWSGMLAFRQDTERGYLALPAYDLAVGVAHKSLFLFDGQGILHGVTPIKLKTPDAKRYSIVYYSLKGMWNCEPIGSELERVKRIRTERERRRATIPAPGKTR